MEQNEEKLLEEQIEKELEIVKLALANIDKTILEMKRMIDENGTVNRFDVKTIIWEMKFINLDLQYLTRRIMSKTKMFYGKKKDEEVEKRVREILKDSCRDAADGKCGCMRRVPYCK